MQNKPTPLAIETPAEVHLPNAPLARVLAQVRFPPILSIGKADMIADFQEELRGAYPHLNREEVQNIDLSPGHEPRSITKETIWRLSDQEEPATWRVSLGVDFVALETLTYTSRDDFLKRLRVVVANVEKFFQPADAKRVGLRYIDQLTGDAVDRIDELVQPNVLGILQTSDVAPAELREATVHLMTEAKVLAIEGLIQGRWGNLPPNTTHDPNALQPVDKPSWVLDLDMFSPHTMPFEPEKLTATAEAFSKRLYSVFREMVTEEFLRFYGGSL